jgi:mannose-6-phosphate isomerase-like protein (cupin superfamily)
MTAVGGFWSMPLTLTREEGRGWLTERMDVRRVVTGHDASGKSVFVSDETVSPVVPMMLPNSEFHLLWGGDKTPQFPDDGTMPKWHTYFPPVGGFRFSMFTVPPETTAAPDMDMEAGVADAEAKLPGLLRYLDPSEPGMHTTDTIDFEVVLEGTIVLELDDGAEVTLHPGDTVVQNGTRHRWKNPGDTPARVALFVCGASHAGVPAS